MLTVRLQGAKIKKKKIVHFSSPLVQIYRSPHSYIKIKMLVKFIFLSLAHTESSKRNEKPESEHREVRGRKLSKM